MLSFSNHSQTGVADSHFAWKREETQGFITTKRLHIHETMPRENIKTAEELAEVGDSDTVAVAVAASRVQDEDEDN
jgi:hypothetical protein